MPAANDPKKLAAVQLMAEGRKLAEQRNYGAARVKYMEADRLRSPSAPNEFNPGFALQDLNARGIRDIEAHVAESHKMIAKKDYEKADADLTAGGQIAASLGLFARPVEDARASAPHRLGRQVRRPRADRDDPGPHRPGRRQRTDQADRRDLDTQV